MKKCVVAMLVLVVGFALAEEFPYVPGITHNIPGTTPIQLDQTELKSTLINEPVWKTLERMIQTERENSEIQLVLEKNATDEAAQMAHRIENEWNSGEFEKALALFPELAELTDINEMSIGNTWRTPVQTQGQSDWGDDVRIGNRDSVYICVLDMHTGTSNLFAIILYNGDGNTSRWAVNFSTNGGSTWSETYDWWANYDLNSLDAVVVANHCYVGFGRGSSQDQAFLYRFRVTDGTQEDFPNASSYVTVFTTTSPDAIVEVSLWSNHDQYDSRIYYSAIINNGQVRALWDDPDAITWIEYTTNITNAERGLDAGWNQDYTTRYHWLSYLSNSDNVVIHSAEGGVWSQRVQYSVGTSTDYTSIGVYKDTVIAFFDYHGAACVHVRYLVSYNEGASWGYGFVDDTTTIQESPDVTARRGGGQGVVYRFYTSPRQLRFNWRNYAGAWPTPVVAADNEPYYNKPSIEYLGGGVHGVVFLCWNNPYIRAAYFTRSDWTGIAEETSQDVTARFINLAPNPSNGIAKLSYVVKTEGNVNISVFDAAGRSVSTLVNENKPAGEYTFTLDNQNLAAGIYFVRVQTPDGLNTQSMTIIR